MAPWLCGSVLEPALWMLSLRNVRSDLKLHSAPQTMPGEARLEQGSPGEVQGAPERVPETPLKEYSGAWAPQKATKMEGLEGPQNVMIPARGPQTGLCTS